MYNHLLDSFKAVAEEGSFNRAAERLYITNTAVRKQVGQLETYIGVRLFDRRQTGTKLTAAGKILYARTLELQKRSEEIIHEVQAAYLSAPKAVRVGSSNLYPCYAFMDMWDKISGEDPQWQLKVVFIDDDHNSLNNLGKDYDFLVGPFDSLSEDSPYAFRQIGAYRFKVAVPRSNPLSSRSELSLRDLAGQPLMIMTRGGSPVNDRIRDDIAKRYPEVNIVDIRAGYNIQTFNHAVETGSLLLSLECWDRIHPELKSITLKEKYEIPYGIVYRKDSELMSEYVEQLGDERLE